MVFVTTWSLPLRLPSLMTRKTRTSRMVRKMRVPAAARAQEQLDVERDNGDEVHQVQRLHDELFRVRAAQQLHHVLRRERGDAQALDHPERLLVRRALERVHRLEAKRHRGDEDEHENPERRRVPRRTTRGRPGRATPAGAPGESPPPTRRPPPSAARALPGCRPRRRPLALGEIRASAPASDPLGAEWTSPGLAPPPAELVLLLVSFDVAQRARADGGGAGGRPGEGDPVHRPVPRRRVAAVASAFVSRPRPLPLRPEPIHLRVVLTPQGAEEVPVLRHGGVVDVVHEPDALLISDLLRLERFHRIDHDVAHRPTRARLESAAGRGKLRLRPLVAVASCPPGRARRWDGIREALARGVIALRRETPAPRAAAGVRVQDVREVREIHRQAPPAPIRVAAMGRRGLREASEGGWEGEGQSEIGARGGEGTPMQSVKPSSEQRRWAE